MRGCRRRRIAQQLLDALGDHSRHDHHLLHVGRRVGEDGERRHVGDPAHHHVTRRRPQCDLARRLTADGTDQAVRHAEGGGRHRGQPGGIGAREIDRDVGRQREPVDTGDERADDTGDPLDELVQ